MAYYYGFSWTEVDDMPIKMVGAYMNCLEIIQSQEALVDLETNTFPHLTDRKKRQKVLKKYEDVAFKLKEKEIVNVEDMVRKLSHGR